MPYIKDELKDRNIILAHLRLGKLTPGELNFYFTDLITNYLSSNGKSYQSINDIIGALEGAKQEFYRRIVVPYEDQKIKENGDVYDPNE